MTTRTATRSNIAKQQFMLILDNQNFREVVASLRQEYGLPGKDFDQDDLDQEQTKTAQQIINGGKLQKEFDKTAKAIIRRFNIGENNLHRFKEYLVFNRQGNFLQCGYPIISYADGAQTIQIEIDCGTRLKDIENLWEFVEYFQKGIAKERKRTDSQPMRNLERDSFMFNQRLRGVKYEEIVKMVRDQFGEKEAVNIDQAKQAVYVYRKKVMSVETN
ncbi:MAG: hypothetical protein LBG64_00600 [Pseudomonadales bacterium]|jgi:hypothetical protein|nr:hypothetical protein [Pseudomonadales bacterium]